MVNVNVSDAAIGWTLFGTGAVLLSAAIAVASGGGLTGFFGGIGAALVVASFVWGINHERS